MNDSIESLKAEMEQNKQKIRELKKVDSEINLQLLTDKFTSDNPDEIREVMQACYSYIANHRLLVKSGFVTNRQLRKKHPN